MSTVGRVLRMAVGLPLLASACTSTGDPHSPAGRTALVYEAAVREIVAGEPSSPDTSPPSTGDDKPVVYVVAVDGTSIAPDVQAKVADRLVDDIDLRFADERSEAIDDGEPDEPVRSDGVLLVVGEVPDDERPFDLQIERYSTASDRQAVTMSFEASGDTWRVTSTSLAALDG